MSSNMWNRLRWKLFAQWYNWATMASKISSTAILDGRIEIDGSLNRTLLAEWKTVICTEKKKRMNNDQSKERQL